MSGTPKIINAWMSVTRDCKEIKLDWGNDRHHAVAIESPYTSKEVAEALRITVRLIEQDELLR